MRDRARKELQRETEAVAEKTAAWTRQAVHHHRAGELEAAKSLYKDALRENYRVHGARHLACAATMCDLALLYRTEGESVKV